VEWIDDRGSDVIEADRLDRIGYLGTFTSGPNGETWAPAVDGPQAYLAIQGAATEPLRAHFHQTEQFQWFAHGSGTVGGHEVAPGTVHYTDRYTPYGPLRPGPSGMSYVTMRRRHDPGTRYMPDSRADLAALLPCSPRPASTRRALTVPLGQFAPGDGTWVDVQRDGDGFRIALAALAADAASDLGAVRGGGAYMVVVAGSVVADGVERAACAFTWLDPGERCAVVAGSQGARLALLQFPAVPDA
jgi:hypothetical protein